MAGIAQVTMLTLVAPVSAGPSERLPRADLSHEAAATGEGIIELTWTISLSAGRAVIYKQRMINGINTLAPAIHLDLAPNDEAGMRSIAAA
jgi:hypothetical protein